jgi:hypothetical protein
MFFIVLVLRLGLVNSVGRMIDPPHRGTVWRYGFDVPADYNDMSLNCGGKNQQWSLNKGNCGVCGDPFDALVREHEPGGKYATGIISKKFDQGTRIQATIELESNTQGGWFEFRLCVNNERMRKVKQDCFDRNLLKILNQNEFDDNEYRFHLKNNHIQNFYAVQLQLPENIHCKYCILQFRYHILNSLNDINTEEAEEIYNCADIEIVEQEKDKMEQQVPRLSVETSTIAFKDTSNLKNTSIGHFCLKTNFLFILLQQILLNTI